MGRAVKEAEIHTVSKQGVVFVNTAKGMLLKLRDHVSSCLPPTSGMWTSGFCRSQVLLLIIILASFHWTGDIEPSSTSAYTVVCKDTPVHVERAICQLCISTQER